MEKFYKRTKFSEIDLIKKLWEELNNLHKKKSNYFKGHFKEKRLKLFEDIIEYI